MKQQTLVLSYFIKLIQTTFLIMVTIGNSFYAQSTELTKESEVLIENLQGQIKSTMVAVIEAEKKAGHTTDNFHLLFDLPAEHYTNLGMVLDLDENGNGYRVLSVTPESMANSIGIKRNDLITSINDIQVFNSSARNAYAELENAIPGEKVKFTINRNAESLSLEAVLPGVFIPAIKLEIGSKEHEVKPTVTNESTDECGSISVFFKPPQTKRLFSSFVNKINNKPVARGRETFRLKPGKYTIDLHELIIDRFFKRRSVISSRAKPIEIEIKTDTTYHLAAKLIKGKFYSDSRGEYWEPVVWKVSENRKCKL